MMVRIRSPFLLLCALSSVIVVVSSNSCTSDRDCFPDKTFQACRGGICKCSAVGYFNAKSNTCQITVRGSCELTSKRVQPCVDNAYCFSKVKGATSGRCECNKNYEEDVFGQCSTASHYFASTVTLISLLVFPFIFPHPIS